MSRYWILLPYRYANVRLVLALRSISVSSLLDNVRMESAGLWDVSIEVILLLKRLTSYRAGAFVRSIFCRALLYANSVLRAGCWPKLRLVRLLLSNTKSSCNLLLCDKSIEVRLGCPLMLRSVIFGRYWIPSVLCISVEEEEE